MEHLADWCSRNSLLLNVDKVKEKSHPCHSQLLINNTAVEVEDSTKFLWVIPQLWMGGVCDVVAVRLQTGRGTDQNIGTCFIWDTN